MVTRALSLVEGRALGDTTTLVRPRVTREVPEQTVGEPANQSINQSINQSSHRDAAIESSIALTTPSKTQNGIIAFAATWG